MEWYEKYAKIVGVDVNYEIKDLILEGLERNLNKYGARYCPCRINRDKDTICPCTKMRQDKECHCKLFMPKNN